MEYSISKKQFVLLFTAVIAIALTLFLQGCSARQVTEESPTKVAANTTVISPYEKAMDEYKAIIEDLPEGSAYAFADMSAEHDALLVTDAPISFNGEMEAAKATVYGYDKNGKIKNYGIIESTSTSMPIVVKDHYAYFGSHHVIYSATIDEANSKLVIKEAKENDKNYEKLFKGYSQGTIVNFTSDNAAQKTSEKVAGKALIKFDNHQFSEQLDF